MKNFIIYIIIGIIMVTSFIIADQIGIAKLDEGTPIINININ